MGRFLIFSFLIFISQGINAQSLGYTDIVNQHISWYTLGVNYKLTSKLSFDGAYEFRRTDWGSNWTQSFFQGIAHYKSSEKITLHTGILFLKHFPYGKQPGLYDWLEYRPVLQATYTEQLGRFKFKNRHTVALRINEQKNFDAQRERFTRSEFVNMPWYRGKIGVEVPLNHLKVQPKTFYLNISEEVFFGFGKNAPNRSFVQNRFISGLGYKIDDRQKIETAYMLQRINKADGVQAERNHTSQLKYLLHFKRKKK